MAERSIDFGTLKAKDWAIGIGLVMLMIALFSGLLAVTNIVLADFVPTAAGAALGVMLWFVYLSKRKS